MATTTEQPDNETKVEEKSEATEGNPAVEQEDSKATKVKLKEVSEEKPKSGGRLAKILAVVVFACIAGGAVLLLQEGIDAEPKADPDTEVEAQTDLDPALSARELIQVGQNALNEGDLSQAARCFEGARLKAGVETNNDVNLTVDVYQGLAAVETARGNDNVAEMYRDYIRTKQSELGASLPIFNEAERLFREGNQIEARKQFARFLLLADSLDEAGSRYIEIAKRHVADSYETEYRTSYAKKEIRSLTNPEEFFHEVR